MKVMLLDNDTERSEDIKEGLVKAGYPNVLCIAMDRDTDLLKLVRQHTPDMIIIDMESPDRDTLESLRSVDREIPRPIVFFADRSDYKTTQAAINAGVSAYIVDGLSNTRLKAVLDVAIARFKAFHDLRSELEGCKQRLDDRKDVDKAKGILMEYRQLNEEAAYQLLRKMAMDRNMKIGEAARNFIASMTLLDGKL
ncbi:MAG: Response regulator NasT [uncultured Thiotrichaceae bacterium]|uniref:Response regulator NasT n=1 Tax=uncultured Thiotrichaceae bacterium TaxID=298394 RepID=A0A6S6U693_9GAMM|nr:MAG: Response regulator NasT [uncultured Thiotrichaceae bacterium]